MRFHLDEHVARAVATRLRRGIDVTTTPDADFLRLAAEEHPHLGIVFLLPDSHPISEVVRFLALLHDCMEENEMINKVQYF